MIPVLFGFLSIIASVPAGVPPKTPAGSPIACMSADRHPFHVSLAEADFDPAAGALQIALKVNPVDLEALLSRRAGAPVNLEKLADLDARISAYLSEVFQIRMDKNQKAPTSLRYAGTELSDKSAWLYFEFPKPAAPGWDWNQCELSNRIFFELENDQTNTVILRNGAARATLRFTRAQSWHSLRLP